LHASIEDSDHYLKIQPAVEDRWELIHKPDMGTSQMAKVAGSLYNAWEGSEMNQRRLGIERRDGRDRRNGGSSNYTGPERRGLRFRRSDEDRRKKAS